MNKIAVTAVSIDKVYHGRVVSPRQDNFYESSGHFNFGYWNADTRNGRQAGDNLVDQLLRMLPQTRGNVLDVACGLGGTTHRLGKHFGPDNVTGINISEEQVCRARSNAPGCRLLQMDAVNLEFEDASFDNVICIEAAFHFNTRVDFLREAFRVLKPGGHLVLSDILMHSKLSPVVRLLCRNDITIVPKNNYVTEPNYIATLETLGFDTIEVIDAMQKTYVPFCRRFLREAVRGYFDWKQWPGVFTREFPLPMLYLFLTAQRHWFSHYLLVAAEKSHRCTT